jgi:hypothetical protein
MQLSKVQKRMGQLENALMDLGPRSTHAKDHHDLPALILELSALVQDAEQIEKRTITRGDDGTALDAMREVCRIVELIARLGGQLSERSTTNIINVNIDHDTAQRIAEIYAKRHKTTE